MIISEKQIFQLMGIAELYKQELIISIFKQDNKDIYSRIGNLLIEIAKQQPEELKVIE